MMNRNRLYVKLYNGLNLNFDDEINPKLDNLFNTNLYVELKRLLTINLYVEVNRELKDCIDLSLLFYVYIRTFFKDL
jgi:hypothetical protein